MIKSIKSVLKDKQEKYDMIIYPNIENVPARFAISHRNRWMVDVSDFIIAYINHNYGGAYSMYAYAKKRSKEIFNIAE